ncbi:unnamed protein product [Gongylonema pulchrum]|uniref:Pentatricopeptide repeat-containing protein n=1 Tax=Gongylonema pulchrum TaxID=637853 RepID=A0A183DIT3_9BILA|nr:unnamed protein product [Gongylonema pulchrum]
MADLFGPDCKYLSLSVENYDGALQLMEQMVRTIRLQKAEQRKSLLNVVKIVHDQSVARKMKAVADKSRICSVS